MKKFRLYRLILIFAFGAFSSASAAAQTEPAPTQQQQQAKNAFRGGGGGRLILFRELGLSAEQLQQIRRLNVERKPSMNEAQRRFAEAQRRLNAMIYADAINETEIENRLKELQTAQAEIARIKAKDELEVRKILTPEQLVKFRELVQRFADRRRNFRQPDKNAQPIDGQNNFNRRLNRRLRQNSQIQ